VGYRENGVVWLYELATGERLSLEISGRIWEWLLTFILIRAEGSDILWRYDIAAHELISLEIRGSVVGRSPSQRYLVIDDGNALYLYDTQNNLLTPLDLGYPVRFVTWTEHESQMFLYADVEAGETQTFLRYDFASGETETLFETSGSIWTASQHGDWLFIHYSPEGGDSAHARFLLRNRETGVELEVEMYYDNYLPSDFVSLSPDGHWLVLNADDAVYLFDMTDANGDLQLLAINTSLNYGVSTSWSRDSHYVAFSAEGQVHLLDVESGTLDMLPGTSHELIGWQRAGQPYVILCSGGGDGNA
jgi:hypothetical protein